LHIVPLGEREQALLGKRVGSIRNCPDAGGLFLEIIVVHGNNRRSKNSTIPRFARFFIVD
jgi:hypothetical protein